MMRKRIFTSGEAARICGLSVSTLKRWIQREALRSFRTPGGDIRILKSDLLDFMRRYGIPLPMDLAPEPAVLLAVDSPEIRRCLRAALASTAIATREAQDDFALGCSLSKGDVTHLIIQSRPQTDDLERCAAIRDAVAPRHIRICLLYTS
ncbi:MAG: helix-turn-helix domain-containing protein, partial [Planctomycetota bacterium]|nr:helix-turn-helix domain-containing protein [Planctomycetota bacterium]